MPPRSPTGSLPANDSACQGRLVGRSHELLSTAGSRGRPAVVPSSERHVPRPWGPIRVGHPVPFTPVAGSRGLLHPVWHAAQLAPRARSRAIADRPNTLDATQYVENTVRSPNHLVVRRSCSRHTCHPSLRCLRPGLHRVAHAREPKPPATNPVTRDQPALLAVVGASRSDLRYGVTADSWWHTIPLRPVPRPGTRVERTANNRSRQHWIHVQASSSSLAPLRTAHMSAHGQRPDALFAAGTLELGALCTPLDDPPRSCSRRPPLEQHSDRATHPLDTDGRRRYTRK